MSQRIIFCCLLILDGCAAPRTPPEPQPIACTAPRPQVCTMLYAPVCATHLGGEQRSHASGCNACADDSVVEYRDGPCEAPAP